MDIWLGEPLRLTEAPECPVCHAGLSGVTATEKGRLPNSGDFSICAYCCTVLRFGLGLTTLAVATPDELRMLYDCQPETFAALEVLVAASREVRADRQRKKHKRN
jgi:hypothetical protein